MFDSLADLVEHFKKTGIEEMSGSFVYLKQVNPVSSVSLGSFGGTHLLFVSALCPSPPFLHSIQRRLCSPAVSLAHANPLCFPIPSPTMLRG